MKKNRILTLMSIVGVLGISAVKVFTTPTPALAYDITDFTLTLPSIPSVSISMNQPIVGDNNLDQINGLPSSTSFYKPVDINVSDVKSYYVSVFLDCSSLSGNDKFKCESGNLLTSSGDTLKSVDNAKTFGTMQNEWGFRYNIGSGVQDPKDKYFAPLPTAKSSGYIQLDGEERIKTGATYSDNKTLTLGFGAKVNGDTAAGTYNGKVTVAVVASPKDAFGAISTLQQMNHATCQAANIHDTVYLKDERDNKKYWVTKLEDGHCWMSQNLDLDVYANESDNSVYAGTFDKYIGNSGGILSSTGVKLTKDNTDITDDVLSTTKMPKSTAQNVTLANAAVATGDMSKHSWDQGLWVINDPVAGANCGEKSGGIIDCATLFTDVSDSMWEVAKDPNFTNLSSYKQNGVTYAKTAGSPIDEENHVYDAHYLIGNYYQYNTATVSSATSGDANLVDIDATDSLCPKDWKLPSSNTMEDINRRSSLGLILSNYGIDSSPMGVLNSKNTNIALNPLFYVRSGDIDPNKNSLFSSGHDGFYWSARVHKNNPDVAYDLHFWTGTNSVHPAWGDFRYLGFPMRCVMY